MDQNLVDDNFKEAREFLPSDYVIHIEVARKLENIIKEVEAVKKPKISLGGKNSHGRMSGTRSSRVSSTIFKKLQKLDREISKLQNQLNPFNFIPHFDFKKHHNQKLLEKIKKLDLKRKEVRLERKKHKL